VSVDKTEIRRPDKKDIRPAFHEGILQLVSNWWRFFRKWTPSPLVLKDPLDETYDLLQLNPGRYFAFSELAVGPLKAIQDRDLLDLLKRQHPRPVSHLAYGGFKCKWDSKLRESSLIIALIPQGPGTEDLGGVPELQQRLRKLERVRREHQALKNFRLAADWEIRKATVFVDGFAFVAL